MFKLSIFIIYTIKAYTCIVLKFDVFHFNVIFVRYILVGRPSGELDLVWFDFILWVDILILTCVTLHSNLFLEPNRAMRVQFLVQVNNRPTTLIQITFSSVSRARYVNHSRASSYGLINYVQNNPEFTKYFKWSEHYLFFAYCKQQIFWLERLLLFQLWPLKTDIDIFCMDWVNLWFKWDRCQSRVLVICKHLVWLI